MQSLCVLGRQPALGLAELESLYGPDKVRRAGEKTAVLNIDPCLLAFERLGGSVKFCKILTELATTSWPEIEKFLLRAAPGHAQNMPAGKMRLGLSAIGLAADSEQLTTTGLRLKKAIAKTGRNVRLIPNKSPELSSAQVGHNKLTGRTGWELVVVKDDSRTIIAQTVKVQNLNSYTLRDRGRPKRDPRVGMLPPKLAQIITNLAVGKLPEEKLQSICEVPAGEQLPRPEFDQTILDPFCGTGVILQEAALMGYAVYGSDIEPRMADFASQNLNWLNAQFKIQDSKFKVEVGDATNYHWGLSTLRSPPSTIASETYLGRPFTAPPTTEVLARTVGECNLIIKKFLQNVHNQLKPGARLCVATPAWQIKPGQFKHLPLVDQISDLGYNLVKFEHVRPEDLIYFRENQIVARQLLVLNRQ